MKWAATLAVVTAAVCLASVQAECPGTFIAFDDDGTEKCLYFLRFKNNWLGARSACQTLGEGYDLAVLTGTLHQQVIEYIYDQPADDLDDEAFWIAGSDALLEGSWKWVTDNTDIQMGTPHWYPCRRHEEPDGGTNQNYLCLYTPDFYFHSCDGDDTYFAICQYIAPTP